MCRYFATELISKCQLIKNNLFSVSNKDTRLVSYAIRLSFKIIIIFSNLRHIQDGLWAMFFICFFPVHDIGAKQ